MCDLEDRVSSDPVMKKLALTGLATALLTSTALAGSIRVENHDSKTYKVELKCSGSSTSIEIKGSTTTSYTFHSSAKECDIVGGGLSFPVKKLEDGQKWKINNGKAEKN